MGNKDAKKVNQLADQERARATKESDDTRAYMLPERHAEKEWADNTRNSIMGGYQGLMTGEGLGAPGSYGGGGGFSAPHFKLDSRYAPLEKDYKKFSGGLHTAMGGYGDFAKTGGISNESRDRIRGNGVFDEFARTGGVSDADAANMRARGIAPISSFYGNLKNQMARRQGVTGGYGAGYDSVGSKMARDSAIAGAGAARDTELGLSETIRSGRMQGANALSGAEGTYAGMMQQGRLAGLGGLTDIGKFGYQGREGIAAKAQSIANANRSAASSASNANRSNAMAEQKYRDQMRLAGLGGMQDMYGANAGELSRYDSNLFTNRGLTSDVNQNSINTRAQNIQPSVWDNVAKYGTMAAGIGGAAFTGGASLGLVGVGSKLGNAQMANPFLTAAKQSSGGYNPYRFGEINF